MAEGGAGLGKMRGRGAEGEGGGSGGEGKGGPKVTVEPGPCYATDNMHKLLQLKQTCKL